LTDPDLLPAVLAAGDELIRTAAATAWSGPDPYDGLLHPWPAFMRLGPRRRQVIVQLHARAPIDVRRLYARREQPRIAKALGLFGLAALRLEDSRHEPAILAAGTEALTLLADDHRAGDAWGYPFDVQTRWSFYPAGTPNVVVSSFAGAALTEAAGRLGVERFAQRARGAAEWTLGHAFNRALGIFSYHEYSDAVIHNANLLGARLVWSQLADDADAREAVRAAVERSLTAQAPDGSWRYGEQDGLGWSDSFHTGFVLLCLAAMRDVDSAVDEALARGARSYADCFFGPRGEARLWRARAHPEDAHAAGTGLSALSALAALDLIDPALLALVASRVVSHGIANGHATWRRGRLLSSRVAYLRWCDAHVALGLADAAVALGAPAEKPAPGPGGLIAPSV
jgi:hypothetical protein